MAVGDHYLFQGMHIERIMKPCWLGFEVDKYLLVEVDTRRANWSHGLQNVFREPVVELC